MLEPLWMWGILGFILLALEMATGTFYILWFGVAALCLSVVLWLFPAISVALQFFLFAVLSLSSLAIWKLNYKKTSPNSRIGQSQGDEIGRIGTITEAVQSQAEWPHPIRTRRDGKPGLGSNSYRKY